MVKRHILIGGYKYIHKKLHSDQKLGKSYHDSLFDCGSVNHALPYL